MYHRLLVLVGLVARWLGAAASFPWLDPSRSVQERVDLLVGNLTLEEKVSQLVSHAPRVARVGLPAYVWRNNVEKGPVDNGVSTIFPEAIALAASWDVQMITQSAKVWAHEVRAAHNSMCVNRQNETLLDCPMNYGLDLWGPNINLVLDPRWGRAEETYGEDPYLTGTLASAVVRALQETNSGTLKTLATVKHFFAYDRERGRLSSFAEVSAVDREQYFLPAFQQVVEAGAVSIMCSYNGVTTEFKEEKLRVSAPMCVSPALHAVLRKRWDFGGYITTDTGALYFAVSSFKYFSNATQAAAAGLEAGVDLNSGSVFKELVPAVRAGLVKEELVDTAVRRLMQARIRLGTLDPALSDPFAGIPTTVLNSQAHREVALHAARSSIVLVKVGGDALPLPVGQWKKVAASRQAPVQVLVVGPAANDTFRMVGSPNYHGCRQIDPKSGEPISELMPECGVQSPLQGLEQVFAKAAGDSVKIVYTPGSDQAGNSTGGIAAATRLARDSQAVIAFVGLSNSRGCAKGPHPARCEGEGRDRDDIELPKAQQVLLDALLATGKPVILVLSTGSAVAFGRQAAHPHCSILVAWYGGRMGAQALAETLIGHVSPSGRLPITFYANTAQLPDMDKQGAYRLQTGLGRTNRYFRGTPLFAFGFGLSYSKFLYSNVRVEPARISTHTASFKVCGTVVNRGPFHGQADETVMVFARFEGPGYTASRPLKVLAGFAKIRGMISGEARQVCIMCSTRTLQLVGAQEEMPALQPGPYKIYFGGRAPGSPGVFVDQDFSRDSSPLETQLLVDQDEEKERKVELSSSQV